MGELVFTCLASRAIHIELLETMDASSFLCALRRFFAVRGPALRLRCDRGTNFVGAKTEIDQALAEVDKESVARYLSEQGCKWLFNPPHASHFGGAWERQIGTIRRILDAMLLELGSSQLTHELQVTLMSEVAAIVNSRPITAIPSDIYEPHPLSPAMLLTQKTRPLGPLPGSFTARDLYARQRWRKVQFLADQFWTRWKREYVNNLQARKKWTQKRRNLAVGDCPEEGRTGPSKQLAPGQSGERGQKQRRKSVDLQRRAEEDVCTAYQYLRTVGPL